MYQIYCDNLCIHDDTSPDESLRLGNPRLTLAASAAGALNFTMPMTNVGYNTLERRNSTLHVFRDGAEIWQGRVLSESSGYAKSRGIVAEGALSFLCDTIYHTDTYEAPSGYLALSYVLNNHNSKVALNRQLQVGTVTVAGPCTVSPDYTKSIDLLNQLISDYGGVMRTRIVNSTVYVDWLADYPSTQDVQSVEFGKNLMDFTVSQDDSEFVTAVYGRGHDVEVPLDPQDPDSETTTVPLVVYVTNPAAVAAFGVIEDTLDLGDLTTDLEVQAECVRYLTTRQYDGLTLSLTALDLHILDQSVRPFDLLERVHVTSWAHGMDRYFAVLGLTIPLDIPDGTQFTLGDPTVAYKRRVKTLTERQVQQEQQTEQDIKSGVSEAKDFAEEKADEAYEQASADIETAREEINETMSSLTEGYVFIDTDGTETQGIYITDSPIHSVSEITSSMHVWKWSMTGLGYSDDGGTTWKVAMTFDGKINADMIVTGLLLAQYIRLYGDMSVYTDAFNGLVGGYLGYGEGEAVRGIRTYGIHMYVGTQGNPANEIIVTSGGARMSAGNKHIFVTSGGASIGSDLSDEPCDLVINGNLTVNGTINGQVI